MASTSSTAQNDKPTIVGLYGIPGCGKTYLIKQLEQALGQTYFAFRVQVLDGVRISRIAGAPTSASQEHPRPLLPLFKPVPSGGYLKHPEKREGVGGPPFPRVYQVS